MIESPSVITDKQLDELSIKTVVKGSSKTETTEASKKVADTSTKDSMATARTIARGENASERKVAGDIMISKSAKVSELAQQLAELKGCRASDFMLLIDGKPLSDMSMSLLSLANSKDTEGRLKFQVSLVRKAA